MRLEELIEELHAQADEVMTSSTVSMPELRDRRARERRRRMAGSAIAVALLLPVVWAAGSVGSRSGADLQPNRTPMASPTQERPPARAGWEGVRCNRPQLGGCAVPALLSYRGHLFSDTQGGSQPVNAANGQNLDLSMSTGGASGPHLILVGATGAGPGSRLEVVVGNRPPKLLTPGRLTAIPLTVEARHWDVVVRETGTPTDSEVLRIEDYIGHP